MHTRVPQRGLGRDAGKEIFVRGDALSTGQEVKVKTFQSGPLRFMVKNVKDSKV